MRPGAARREAGRPAGDPSGHVTHTYSGPALDDATLGTLVKEHL
ncbi:hypothetical protein [Longispora fulva]|uniref:Uncharacterized protein n=1 Tax=Longispora fulva TaxID=619741 RepID=A0A8J7KMN5_9ACTN|nr:hypothetical protein [Longispora fulva]MBG6139356.1 hypothetical protein [Longispora fulva]